MTNQWVPISEGFPPEGEFVLIRFDNAIYEVAQHNENGWWSNDNLDFGYGAMNSRVTHWQRIASPDEPSMRYCGYHPDRQLECAYCTGYRDPLHESDGRTSGEPEKQA